ncbi:hypothetical protein [Pantoea sp.]|uniref:hypothetical protein n=1 Tax=Pantoea sp. TaxID=69393 RepID=UPI0025F41934|nr:hypothetical protein [Pantoea sp.]
MSLHDQANLTADVMNKSSGRGVKMNTVFEWRNSSYLISTDKEKSDQKAIHPLSGRLPGLISMPEIIVK